MQRQRDLYLAHPHYGAHRAGAHVASADMNGFGDCQVLTESLHYRWEVDFDRCGYLSGRESLINDSVNLNY